MRAENFFQFQLTWFLETLSLSDNTDGPLSIDEFEEIALEEWSRSELSQAISDLGAEVVEDERSAGNPRVSAYDLTSYYWALRGRINPADMELTQVFVINGSFSELWPSARIVLATLRDISFESFSHPDFEAVPQTCYLTMLSDSDDSFVFPRRDQLIEFITALRTGEQHQTVAAFLNYYDQEISEAIGSGVDMSVENFLWSELLLALPRLSEPSFEAMLDSIRAVTAGEIAFEWSQPPEVPWVIEEDRLQRSMICFKPWPWSEDSLSVFGDDRDTDGYIITRLKRTSEQQSHVSQVQKLMAFWALYEAIAKEQFDLSSEHHLLEFFSEYEDLLEACSGLFDVDIEEGLEVSSDEVKGLEATHLDERFDNAWLKYAAIIRSVQS